MTATSPALEALITEADFTEELRFRLLKTACRILRNREQAEDAVQRAMLLGWTARHQFRGESCLATWMDVITRNVCRMVIRSERGVIWCALTGDEIAKDYYEAERKADLIAVVSAEIGRMPWKQRVVMHGYLISGNTMGNSTVKVRRHRAIQTLKQRLVTK